MLNHNNMPGAGSISDTMEFMRKMWGNMGTPPMGIPTLSVEEINKKITDLKAVASWLELNMNMLRATIQTLEVQSATLSTLQAMGAILTPKEGAATNATAAAAPFGFPGWPMPQQAAAKADSKPTQPEPRVEDMEDEEEQPDDPAATASGPAAGDKAAIAPDLQAGMVNPNAWWNLLQEQFQQAVGNVLEEQGGATPEVAPPKKTTKAKAAAKPRTRAKSTVVQSPDPKSAPRKPKSP